MTDDPRFPPNPAPRLIDILTFEGGQLLDVAGPLQVFASCNSLLRRSGRAEAYQTRVLARNGGAVTTSSGLALVATALPAMAADLHEDPVALKLALTSYLLSLAVFIPLSGWAADHFGARRVTAR